MTPVLTPNVSTVDGKDLVALVCDDADIEGQVFYLAAARRSGETSSLTRS